MSLSGFNDDEIEVLFYNEHYTAENKEIHTDDLNKDIELKLKFSFDDYHQVIEKLKAINESPERAIKVLLKI